MLTGPEGRKWISVGRLAQCLLLPQTQFNNRGLVSYMCSSGRILEVSNRLTLKRHPNCFKNSLFKMRVWSASCKSGEKVEWSGQESANGIYGVGQQAFGCLSVRSCTVKDIWLQHTPKGLLFPPPTHNSQR